jgi:hypothetical protein
MKSLLLAVFFAFAFSTSTFAVFNVAGMGYVISGNSNYWKCDHWMLRHNTNLHSRTGRWKCLVLGLGITNMD